jgi:phosphonate transport system substrate-binding protein
MTDGEAGQSLLRVAIAGVLSPTRTIEYYQSLVSYMGQTLDRRAMLILKPTYAEINDLIRGQRAEVGFICSLAYVQGNQSFGLELLVAPEIKGETVYYSYLIVPKESGATRLEDLRGASFAFTDPLSNSGHLVPVYQLSLLGESPASFFSRTVFTYSHDNSITGVAGRLVDGAAVDSLVYDQLIQTKPELVSRTKIVSRWGPYGIPPVVVSPALDSELKRRLKETLINLPQSDKGRAALTSLGIDRFVIVPDDNYDSIRQMKVKLGW